MLFRRIPTASEFNGASGKRRTRHITGVFSWYANPLYWMALGQHNRARTIMFCVFALLFAMSFIFDKRVAPPDLDFQEDVTALGWGYFLWVLSIAVLLFGQAVRFSGVPPFLIPISIIIPIYVGYNWIYNYYYIGKESQYLIQSERNRIYDLECKDADTEVFSSADNVESIYLDDFVQEYQRSFFWWKKASGGFSIPAYVNSGYLVFGEEDNYTNNDKNPERNTPYVRYSSKKYNHVNEIKSDIAIYVERKSYSKKINLIVESVTVEDLRKGEVLVTSKYVYDEHSRRLCGATGWGEYSLEKVIVKALGLRRQYPSIYQ